MAASTEDRLTALERDNAQMRRELTAWKNLVVAIESGGGSVTVGDNQVILRINALTPVGVQVP